MSKFSSTTVGKISCALTFAVLSVFGSVNAQAQTISCPSNITVNNTSGQCSANVTYSSPTVSGTCAGSSQTVTFNYTGNVQTWTVPAGVTSVQIDAWGGQGRSNGQNNVAGGRGGYAEGARAVTPGQVLRIYVGGGGGSSVFGGWNGGGRAGNTPCSVSVAGGGGGASDVRIGGTALSNRVIVAGGGGGAGGNRNENCGRGTGGGGGGGWYGGGGGAAWPGVPPGGPVPTGGTQTAGGAGGQSTYTSITGNDGQNGSFGVGGDGGQEISSAQFGSATARPGGTGGGTSGQNGQYDSNNNWTGQSGAGGSGYIGGVTSGSMQNGIRSGNGLVRITYTSQVSPTLSQTAGLASGASFPVGTTTNTFQATCPSSSPATCSFTVTVVDNEDPTISCPSNITVNNTANQCGANVTYSLPTANDNCTSSPTLSRTAGPASGSFFSVGTTNVTYQATDGSGNTASCTFSVTVNDNQNPSITCPSNITTNASNNACSATVSYSSPTVTDNCPGATSSLTSGQASGTNFSVGTSTVTYTATDASGNTASCSFTVTVNDNQNPSISCPSNQTVNTSSGNCSATVTYSTPTASDNCPGVSVGLTSGPASGGTFNAGTTTVTYTATDASSNTATCSFTVTVVDNEDPTINGCPSNITTGTDPSQCSAAVSWTAPTVSDNCSGATITQTAGASSGSSFGIGTATISYTATDGAGNTASCSFTVTVSDDEDPSISCPSNITVPNASGLCTATVTFANASFSDNCSGATLAQTAGSPSGSVFSEGTQTITFTATDAAGNTASCSFTVTVEDTEEPVFFNCPANISVGTDAGVCSAVVSYATLAATDNCDGTVTPVQTAGIGSGGTFPEGVTTETWTATDGEGNVATCSFTVTVTDDEGPQINCPSDQTVTFDGNCQYELLNYVPQVGFLDDNCDANPTVTQSPAATTVITGSTEITMTAEDDEGNTASCTFFVNPNDVVNPTITCPSDQDVSVNSICQFTLPDFTNATVSDDCDPSPTVTQSPAIGSILTTSTVVTLTVTDGSGNSASCSFNADPLDDTDPSISCPLDQLEDFDTGCEFDLVDYTGMASASDNCDASPSVTQSPAVTTTISGTTVVTLTAEDASGNTSSCTFSVIPDDNTDPVVTCPSDLNVSFNSLCAFNIVDYTGSVTATDNCDNSLTLTQTPVAGTAIGTTTTVEVFATDDDGNVGSCTFQVIPADNAAPSVSCPTDQIVAGNASCEASLASYVSLAVVDDNCDSSPTVSQSPAAATTISGSTTVTITAEDASGNDASCTFNVIVNDQTDPTITCGADLNVSFDSDCEFTLGNYVGTASASDNCDATPTVTQSPSAGTTITATATVTLTATDDAGNTATCTFSVIPADNQNPSVSCPSNVNVNFNADCEFALADYTGSATVSDNCDVNPTVTQSPAFGTVITSTQVVTITATDDGGNANSCTFSVIPADNTDPVITCPTDQSENFGANCDFALPDYTSLATATDNCDNSVAVTQSPAAATVITGGQVITLTAEDNNGNTSTCTFSVLPDDNTDPTIVCPSNQTVSFNAQCQFALQNYTSLGTPDDNCDTNPVVTQSPVSGTNISATTTVTLTATDANGNTGTCTFDVIPEDNTDPTIACPADQNVDFDANCEYDLLTYTALGNTDDNCDPSPTVTQSPAAGTTITATQTVTLTVEDADGNTGTCTFDVIPADNTIPSITCGADLNVSFDANCQYTLTSYVGTPTVSDNCDSSPVVTQSPASGTIISGQTEITLTATDASGNINTCTFDVIPDDDVDPTVTCPSDQIISSNVDCDVVVPDYTGSVTALDNCDQSLAFSQSPGSGTIITVATTITVTVTDDNGNSANCSFLVTPADDDNPSITCPGDQEEDFDADCEFAVPDYTTLATATDNCSGAPTVTQDVTVGDLITGTTTITLTATDGDSNTATCSFDVIPDDNTAPTITCPSDQNADLGNQCQLVLGDYTGSASTSDNCDLTPTVVQSPVAGTSLGGATVVTITSTDDNGNIGSCTFTVTPADNTDPVLSCPSNITEAFDGGCEFTLPSYTTQVVVTDNCDAPPFTISQSPAAGTTISGTTTITFSVTDGAGNTGTCSFDVIPDDDQDPTIICPSDATVSFNANCEYTLADYTGDATATDNCDTDVTVTQSPAIGATQAIVTPVTLTATDDAGNTASCSFNVIPEDDTDPTLSCPSNQNVTFTGDCEFALLDYTGSATFSDNCDNSLFATQSPSTGTLVSGTTTVIITVTDDAGNTATCTFDVIPNDTENPTVTCPSNVTETLSASCDFSLGDYTSLATATDNCDTDVTLTQNPAAATTVGSNTSVTITGTDDNGNSASCTFTVVLEDETAPTVTCPTDQNVDFGPSCQFTMLSYVGSASASDNCDPNVSITQSPLAGSSIGGTTTVTIFAEDASGNVGTCTFEIIPDDNQAPNIFGCPADFSVDNDQGSCDAVVTYAAITATDNCDGVVVPGLTNGQASGTVFPLGETTVEYTATDQAGNSTTCEFVVTVEDAEDPIVVCPSSVNTTVDANTCGAVVTYAAVTASDNCTSPITASLDAGLASGSTFPEGTTTITYSATDDAGNTASCSFDVTVVDDEDPVITCPSDITTDADVNSCNAFVNYSLPTVTDNCATGIVPSLTAGQNSGSSFPVGTTTISYIANDGNGNSATCSFTITVEDNEEPLILACPLDITENVEPSTCGATIVYAAVNATDNCAGSITPTLTSGQASGTVFPLGTTTVTYVADDGNGNTSSCSFDVTIIDDEDPIITCPADITVPAEVNSCVAAVTYSLPTITDNCTSPITPVLEAGGASGDDFVVGTTTVTYSADDGNGNTASCSFEVTVTDDEAPVITCPADIVVDNDPGLCGAVVTHALPTITDNCSSGIIPIQTLGLPSGSTFPVGITFNRYQATDDSGNSSLCSFSVTVNDVEDPVLTCPSDITVDTEPGVCQATVSYDPVVVSDNCTSSITAVLVTGLSSGDPFQEGTTTVTYEGTDQYGNSSTCSFDVTVEDAEAPTVACPADQLESFDALCQLQIPDYTGLGTTSDNCDASPVITQSPAPASIVTGVTTVTLISTDAAGNEGTCTFTVSDDTPPVVTCPADQQVGYNINCQYTLLDYTSLATSTDNCGGISLSQSPEVGELISDQTTITITSEDDFGNITTCEFDVIPSDNIAPSIVCLGSQTVFFNENCGYELPDYTTQAVVSDNCDTDLDVTQVPVSGTIISGTTQITLTATDDDGNDISCSFNVVPSDNEEPTIVCPASQLVQLDANCEYDLADYSTSATVSDNCDTDVEITQSPAAGTTLALETIVTLTAEDDAGNSTSCVFSVQTEDVTPPTVSCPIDLEVDLDSNCEYFLGDYSSAVTVSDNCSQGFTFAQVPAVGGTINGSTSVSLTVTDVSGNSSSCTFNVVPSDNTAPEIECAPDLLVAFDENCQYEISDYNGFATADDNCSGNVTITQSPAAGTFITESATVTLTADDGNGNQASCTFDVIPSDQDAPTITCPADQFVSFDGNCEFELPDYTTQATTSDNCSNTIDIVQGFPENSGSGNGGFPGDLINSTVTISLIATDEAGNAAECQFEVVPEDLTAPLLACPTDQEVEVNTDCEFVIPDYTSLFTAEDNCGIVSGSYTPAEGTVISEVTEIVATVSDAAGNTSTCSFTVTPVDNSTPSITCPSDFLVAVDANCQFEMLDYTSQAVVTDNCGSISTVTQFPPVGTVVVSTTEVTLTVDDGSGNTADCTFDLIPDDNTDPEILECAPNAEVVLNANCSATMADYTSLVDATDNCDQTLTITQVPSVGATVSGSGTQSVLVVVTDDAGNTAECQFELTLIDETAPTIECPSDQVLTLSGNCEFVLPDYTSLADADDGCEDVTVSQSPVAGTVFTGQLNATLIVEDGSGNTSSCTFFVNVVEFEVEVTGTSVSCQNGNDGTATASISGGQAPYTQDWGGFNPNALEPGFYTVTVTDANGCTAIGEVTIGNGSTFEIDIDPNGEVVICEGTSLTVDAGAGYAVYDWSTGASVQTINVSNEGDYWVTVTNAQGCVSNTDTVSVVFYDSQVPDVIADANGILSCSNDTALAYQWYLNGDPIPNATESTYCPRQSGNYYVIITDQYGCEVQSTLEEYTYMDDSPCATSIQEYGLSMDIYPNPSNGMFTIDYALNRETDLQIAVFDMMGKQLTEEVRVIAQRGTRRLDLSAAAEGVYMIRIVMDGDKVFQERILVVR